MPTPPTARLLAAGLLACLAGCGDRDVQPDTNPATGPKADGGEVVAYVALDEEFSRPVLKIFESKEGIRVKPQFDIESTKSFGLASRIIAEAEAPLCDLFWNNEIINTLRLKQKGLLEPFTPEHADEFPAQFKAADGTWYGFAARARILLVNTELLPEAEWPDSILDLTDPKYRGRVAIAKPLFGTTGTHAACLFQAWGEDRASGYFRDLKANDVQVLGGNKQVALAVGEGRVAIGLTDTDDAVAEIEAGNPVAIIYPDREPGGIGTLFIPNTLARIKGSPNGEAANALAGYLLSPRVEGNLAIGRSAQIPLNPNVEATPRVETPKTVPPMAVDFEAAAALWEPTVAPFLADLFAGAE